MPPARRGQLAASALAAGAIATLWAGAASADDMAAGAHTRFQAQYLRAGPAAPYRDHVIGGLAMRGFIGSRHVQYAAAIDFELGGTNPGGFAYHQHLRPIGIAFVDEALRLSSTVGIGVDGVTSRVPPTTRIPVDFLLELPLQDQLKIELAGELAWLPIEETRRDGAALASIADESAFSIRLRLDRRFDPGRIARNGIDLGLALRERHGVLLIGPTLGYSLDGTYGF